ncbi:hypothetical protein QYM36_016329 [Artemia franciscana]|uniref:Uncharacterized protein n=1 Tax=Artemia franciscana TaxID=6661 RepID=A0AA88HJ12_ARTSF|nr:hypothetical protein QYM36_016329 [Artemia franciscana]
MKQFIKLLRKQGKAVNIFGLFPSLSKAKFKEEKSGQKNPIPKEFDDVFAGIGKIPGKVQIHVEKNAIPSVNPVRRIPFALHERVKRELERLEKLEIIERVVTPTENRAHLKPQSSAEGNSAQQSSGFTGDEDLPAEFHPPVTQSSSPKKAVPKTEDNRSTGEIFQDSPYRTPRTPTPLPAANSESRNGDDYSRHYVTRTGRVVKPRKIMDI